MALNLSAWHLGLVQSVGYCFLVYKNINQTTSISGLSYFFEQPIKEGETEIEVGDLFPEMSSKSQHVQPMNRPLMTISIICKPIVQFIDSQVINWSHNDRKYQIQLPCLEVSYKEDPQNKKDLN